jgi:phosphatidylinositol glycan class U
LESACQFDARTCSSRKSVINTSSLLLNETVKEGVYLLSREIDPYSGDINHAPPLVIAFFFPLFTYLSSRLQFLVHASLMITVDVITALVLRKYTQLHMAIEEKTDWEEHSLKEADKDEFLSFNVNLPDHINGLLPLHAIPDIVAIVYLLNPYTVMSCLSLSIAPFDHLFVVASLYYGASGHVTKAAMYLACSAYLSFYNIPLLSPVLLMLQRERLFQGRGWSVTALFVIVFSSSYILLHVLSWYFIGHWDYIWVRETVTIAVLSSRGST